MDSEIKDVKPKKIIAFTGPAGSGKDTAANAILNAYPDSEQLSFAYTLKKTCQVLFNLSESQLNDTIEKELVDPRYNKSPRELFQWMGTDIIRNTFGNDFFVNIMRDKINKSNKSIIVINDVRFDNEAELIKSMFGKIVKIERKEQKKVTSHSSENGINYKYIDVIIPNNLSIENLENGVINILDILY